MRKLRTAVVGLGRIGWYFHIPQVLKNEKFELTALVDPLEERRLEGETEFKTETYPDMNSMFETTSLDVVVIASPTPFHKKQAIHAMRNGCDVFCDKPMAMNLDEVDEMILAAKETGRNMMVYQPHRASREAISIHETIKSGIIGPVYMIKRASSDYRRRNDWQAFKKNGGGMLSNYGAHYIDQLMFLTDFTPISKVHCALRNIVSFGDANDTVKAFFENETGVILDIDINMATSIPIRQWQVFGKYGTIIDEDKSWRVKYLRPEKLVNLGVQNGLAAENRQYQANDQFEWKERVINLNEYEPVDFYDKLHDYITLNAKPFVPITQTREVMRLIQECERVAQKPLLPPLP